ncbi:MAG: hypothetical protein JNK82_41600 [Myxococcaceae bacterium]|nr:hypothetical protein [Myxococcaceae bacterium]
MTSNVRNVVLAVLALVVVAGCGPELRAPPPAPPAPPAPVVVVAPPAADAVPVAAPAVKAEKKKFGRDIMPNLPESGEGSAEVKDLPVIGSVTVKIIWGPLTRTDDKVTVPVKVTYRNLGITTTLLEGTMTCDAKGCKVETTTLLWLQGPLTVAGDIVLDANGGGEMKCTVTDGAGNVIGTYVIGFNSSGDFNVWYQQGDGTAGGLGGSGNLIPPE